MFTVVGVGTQCANWRVQGSPGKNSIGQGFHLHWFNYQIIWSGGFSDSEPLNHRKTCNRGSGSEDSKDKDSKDTRTWYCNVRYLYNLLFNPFTSLGEYSTTLRQHPASALGLQWKENCCGAPPSTWVCPSSIFMDAHNPFSPRVDPSVTTKENETTPEEWANRYNKVGVLVELAKVKELSADIMSGSIWSSVQREQMLAMGEKICSQQAKLISLLEKSSLGADSA